jgi:PKD domain/Secretion system C-terminal sorting domain
VTSYAWSNGDTAQTICVTAAGIYTVTVTDSLGCQGTDSAAVTIIPGGITAAMGIDTSNCPVIAFTDQSQVTNAIAWSWSFGDGGTSTIQNPTHDYANAGNGTYTVTLIATDSCGSDTTTSVVTISCIVGIAEGADAQVRIFPNPNQGRFRVTASGLFADELQVQLIDLSGRTVYRQDLQDVHGTLDFELDIQALVKGVYFLNLDDGVQKIVRKVVIQ